MMDGASTAVESAMAELWQPQALRPANLFASPAFIRLRSACQADYPNAARGGGPTFANALRSLGLPCGLQPDASPMLPVREAARRPEQAFRRRESRRLHLCPLDLADDFPPIVFGPVKLYG